jgi:alpha(1,3/1,4) fucosyltransferase
MKRACIVVSSVYQNNKLFDLSNSVLNRDGCLFGFYLLKQEFKKYNIDLSTSDINQPNDSDVVIHNEIPKDISKNIDKNKSYLLLFESELIRPDNWDLEKHKYFRQIFTWNDELIDNKKYFKINFSHLFPQPINKNLSKKENLCTLIAGNHKSSHNLELYSKRLEAIRWFERNHPKEFDFYGMGWDSHTSSNRYIRFLLKKINLSKFFKPNFPCYKGKVTSKKTTFQKYKFAICYENAKDISGYVTEKIFDCFFAGCIPVYWGANNVTSHIPKDCFIDKRNFPTYELLYEYMENMSDERYMKYLTSIELYLESENSNSYTSNYFANTIVKTILDNDNKI